MKDQIQSRAFVKNPTCDTKTAWQKCFLRAPRCIGWDRKCYEELGLNAQQIEKIPRIDRGARIVADVCGVSYKRAMEENYFSRALLEAEGRSGSPTQESIKRLRR